MNTWLILVFLLTGTQGAAVVKVPTTEASCHNTMFAQTQAIEWLNDHPKYDWDGKWTCKPMAADEVQGTDL